MVTSAPDLNKINHPAREGKFVGSNISLARTPSFTVQINGKPLQGGKAPQPQRNSTGSNINVNVSRNSSLLRPSEVKYNSRGAPQSHHQHQQQQQHRGVELRRNNKHHHQQQQQHRGARALLISGQERCLNPSCSCAHCANNGKKGLLGLSNLSGNFHFHRR